MADSSDSEVYLSAEEEEPKDKANSAETREMTSATSELHITAGQQPESDESTPPPADNRTNREQTEIEFVSNLDNRYVSEGTEIRDEKVELTEEQIKEMKEQGNKLKESGNEAFRLGEHNEAIDHYTEALKIYPPKQCEQEVSVCHANRGACYMKLEQHEDVVEDCTKALEFNPDYLKALMRRAQSYEALEKLEGALEDYKKVLEIDPSQQAARAAVMHLPAQIQEQHEKMKEEMLGKLKELGNAVLSPFGLSTNNFKLQKDENTGGYSVNFQK